MRSSAPRTRLLLLAPAALAITLMTGCAPWSPPLASDGDAPPAAATSDEDLLLDLRRSFTHEGAQAAVAVIDGDTVRTAYLDADPATAFEIGSITKTATGLLLAEAVERDEVSADDPVGEYLDLGDSPAASVTFAQLATHSSGLPTFPSDPDWIAAVEADFLAGEDVLDETVPEFLAMVAAEPIAADAPPQYSNLGAALAGQALAAAADTDYRSLLVERVFEPAGMSGAWLPVADDEVPDELATGWLADGTRAEPSTLAAYAPAGGITATLDDMIVYARAVLDGPFDDSAAVERRPGPEGSEMGYFWGAEQRADGHEIVEHGGVTAGFGATLRIDRTAGTAVVVLANRGEPVDDLAPNLMSRYLD